MVMGIIQVSFLDKKVKWKLTNQQKLKVKSIKIGNFVQEFLSQDKFIICSLFAYRTNLMHTHIVL